MKKLSFEEFLEKANRKHDFKYKYDKNTFKTTKDKIRIICPTHGEFFQEVQSHLRGSGCVHCFNEKRKTNQLFSKEKVLKMFKDKHGEKYFYDNFVYSGMNDYSFVTCKIHGDFKIKPSKHILGQGCPCCSSTKKKTLEEIITLSRQIHGEKYDYSKVVYKTVEDKICIVCPIHGDFWQTPHNHINGKEGCPHCNESKIEKKVKNFLKENKIYFEYQKKFSWLGRKSLDFYIPQYNVAIECQGKQHFGIGWWRDSYNEIRNRDIEKKKLCERNGIKIIYFSDKKYEKNLITDIKILLKELRND